VEWQTSEKPQRDSKINSKMLMCTYLEESSIAGAAAADKSATGISARGRTLFIKH
jgi:hypothetical protein